MPGVPAAENGFVDSGFAPVGPPVAGIFGVGLLGACAEGETLRG